MAYVGNTPFGPSCPSPTRVFAQVNTGFRSVRRSVGLAHDPTSQETPARPSPQHAVASFCGPSDSSAVMTRAPSVLNAGELRILGTQILSQASTLTRPPGWPSTHGESWPSWHRFGVM